MAKLLRFVFAFAFVLSLLPASQPVFAQEGKGKAALFQQVRYIFVDKPIIPIGEKIEFVDLGGGQLAVKWQHRVGWGYTTSVLVFDGVEMEINVFNETSSYRKPRAGDVAIIASYSDWYDALGNHIPDGIVDRIEFAQFRQWMPLEVAFLQLAYQFREDLYANNLVFAQLGGDCGTGTITVDGVPAALGPWGNTYRVPAQGGMLSNTYPSDHPCGKHGNEGQPQARVRPGDFVYGGAGELMVRFWYERQPAALCTMLEYQAPQWQPQGLPMGFEYKACDLHTDGNQSARGVLRRMGFQEYRPIYGDDRLPQGIKAFVFSPYPRRQVELPAHRWVDIEGISLGETSYEVKVVRQEPPYLRREYVSIVKSGSNRDLVSPVDWGTPVVFLGKDQLDDWATFDWKEADVYRVVRRGDTAVIQKAVFN